MIYCKIPELYTKIGDHKKVKNAGFLGNLYRKMNKIADFGQINRDMVGHNKLNLV